MNFGRSSQSIFDCFKEIRYCNSRYLIISWFKCGNFTSDYPIIPNITFFDYDPGRMTHFLAFALDLGVGTLMPGGGHT
jgi:hypothetical protein